MAHKVDIFAYIEGGSVFTESHYPDGRPVRDGSVIVYDQYRTKLQSGVTDNDGLFSFPALSHRRDIIIEIDAGMGHKGFFVLTKEERDNTSPADLNDTQRESASQKVEENKPDARDILGGIGIIIGLCTLTFLIMKRKEL